MSRIKIVFMIDTKPLASNNGNICNEDIVKQLRFSILRILTYFGGKHSLSGRKGSLGPLWGYKFYSSSGVHLEYGSHNFFDLKLKDFQRFEEELEDRFANKKDAERCSSSASVADHFSCALTEVLAGFQWERPDFFSPVKSNRRTASKTKVSTIDEPEVSNFVFLFTPCPGCCDNVCYFPHGNPRSSVELKNALIKEEVSKKMINDCRVSFNWVDVGRNAREDTSAFHQMLTDMLVSFSGTLVQIENLSFWWVERESGDILKTVQPGSFGCFMDSLFSQKTQPKNENFNFKMSIDVYKLLISMNDTCSIPETSLVGICLPTILRSAAIKRIEIGNKIITPNITQHSSLDVQDEVNEGTRRSNIGVIVGVFKSSTTLSLLQNCKESYYCSYDFIQLRDKSGADSNTFELFQQLLRILKTKRLILVIRLNHPETGCLVNACFQPWANLSGILTIMTSSFSCEVITKCLGTQNMKEQLKRMQRLIKNIQAKLDITRRVEENHSKDREMMSDLKTQANLSAASSFMQSMDYWFTDLPSHSLISRLHHRISRLQNLDNESFQRANQRSTALFKRLKDYCKKKQYRGKIDEPDKEVGKSDDSLSEGRNLKTRTLSRSALLIENSKVVKMQRKSEDDIKEKDSKSVGAKLEEDIENGNENEERHGFDDDGDDANVFHVILKDGQDFSAITLADLTSYMKNEILSVLTQDKTSCEASAKRLARNLVLLLNKLNENMNNEKAASPDQFLEKVFSEISSFKAADKSVKILRHVLRVFMDLEIAVLTKRNGTIPNAPKSIDSPRDSDIMTSGKRGASLEHHQSEIDLNLKYNSEEIENSSDDDVNENIDPVAERVIEQLRPLVFLENPAFITKHLNTSIFPRFKSKIPHILREIYEGLGQQVPSEIQSPSHESHDADDSFEIINDSIMFSKYGSNNPSNQSGSGSGFRRFVSAGDSIALKRQIVVPTRTKKNANKRPKRGYLSEPTGETKSNKEGWCRNLFETGSNLDKLLPPTGSRKRKLLKQHSELATSVKDTPARKQRRHFFWKRQHKERRKSNGITDITVIEESPLKNCNVVESPTKTLGSSRFLSRSQSFSYKTSPKRFYAPRRNNKSIQDLQCLPRRKKGFERSLSCISSAIRSSDFNDKTNIEADDYQIVFSSQATVSKSPSRNDNRRETMLINQFSEKDCESPLNTPRKRSSSVGADPLAPTDLTANTNFSLDMPQELINITQDYKRPKPILDLLDIANSTNSFGFDPKISSRPLLFSEDSMDWVAMFGNDKQTKQESPLPTIDSVSSFRGSETDSLKGGSPNLSTPLRDGKQPFSSPFLSASSLETLENAPILSPRFRGSKSKRESSCRKRIKIGGDGY